MLIMQRLLRSDIIRTTQNNTELFFCTNLTNLTNGFYVRMDTEGTRITFSTRMTLFNEHGWTRRFTEAYYATFIAFGYYPNNTEQHGTIFLYESDESHEWFLCTDGHGRYTDYFFYTDDSF